MKEFSQTRRLHTLGGPLRVKKHHNKSSVTPVHAARPENPAGEHEYMHKRRGTRSLLCARSHQRGREARRMAEVSQSSAELVRGVKKAA